MALGQRQFFTVLVCVAACRTSRSLVVRPSCRLRMTAAFRGRDVSLPSGEFVASYPVALGHYNGAPSVFLARGRRILDIREEVLPVPVEEGVVSLLSEAMQPRDISIAVLLRTCPKLFGRDGGLYDNLPWGWSSDPLAKREAFQRSQGKGLMGLPSKADGRLFVSAYDLLADVMNDLCPVDVLSLLIEEDESMSGGITLGGSAYIQRRPQAGETRERVVVEIKTDEVVGLCLSLGKQVHVDREIWEGARVRPNFVMSDGKVRMDVDMTGNGRMTSTAPKPSQPPAWTIKSRGALSRMSDDDKRACLRASGVKPPRKRASSSGGNTSGGLDDGSVLDDLLLPLMDEAVRRDVLLARAWRRGDFATANELCEGKSERHVVAEQLQAARKEGDEKLMLILMERARILDQCVMDPTQDPGSYQRDLDADEWYLRNRRI